MFEKLENPPQKDWDRHLNKYNVIHNNMQKFFSNSNSMDELLDLLERSLLWDFIDKFGNVRPFDDKNLFRTMKDIDNQIRIKGKKLSNKLNSTGVRGCKICQHMIFL